MPEIFLKKRTGITQVKSVDTSSLKYYSTTVQYCAKATPHSYLFILFFSFIMTEIAVYAFYGYGRVEVMLILFLQIL